MVYCQECGSEIAEVDTFCPFCGITLQPIISKESENDSTISETFDESEVNADVIEPFDSEIEMTADELTDESDEEIDMSETIVVDPQTLIEPEHKEVDSGYLDISTLKDEESEENELVDDSPIDDFEESPKQVAVESNDEVVESNDEVINLPTTEKSGSVEDVSENQDDIQELLTDEDDEINSEVGNEEEIDDSNLEENDSDDQNSLAYQPTVRENPNEETDDVAETVEEFENENKGEDDSESLQMENEVIDDQANVPEIISENTDNQIHKTPPEIQSAEDSEIDDAVSVIDSKADVWKKEEIITTDSLKDAKSEINDVEKSEIKTVNNNFEAVDIDNKIPTTDAEMFDSVVDEAPELIEESTEESKSEIVSDINSGEQVEQSVQTEPESIETKETIEKQDVEINEPEADVTESTEQETVEEEIIDASQQMNVDISESTEIVEDNESVESEEPVEKQATHTTPIVGVEDTDGSNTPKLKPLEEGTVLNNRYEIVRKIGGGGMGAVYLANDKNLGGVLRAVKEMVQSYIEEVQQDKAVNDFKRESMLLTSLDHHSIPTIYDYFFDEKEGRFYLVMKYISGGDLAARLRSAPEGKLDEISVTDWALQITDVLDYLHSKNPPIVYRDLKPANVMIDGNTDKIMLIDFGIARWINKEEKGVTAVGTMGYAPPELFSGNVAPASDIYSLGSTMFHLLTGADPQNNPLLIFDFQKHPRPRQINPQLSDQMERILMRSVEYNAERRFSSAAEMRNSLKEHLENLKAGNVSYGVKETPSSIALSDQPVFCGFCGQKIVATDMFCAFCGAKQPLAQPGVHSEEYNLLKVTAKLIIEGTSELDYPSFELVKDDNLVGRRDPMSNIFPEVDLSKFDPQTKISRKHARIRREGEQFILEDLGSSNGTILLPTLKQKMKITPHQPQVLQNGDKIILGDTTLQFIIL